MYRSLEIGTEVPPALSSRKLAWAFVAIFLIGCLVGGLVTWDLTDTQLPTFLKKTSDPISLTARINDKYTKAYQLTPDQQARIAPITSAMSDRLYKIRNQFATDVISTMDDFHAQVATQMTPDQRAAYEKDNLVRKQKVSAMLFLNQSSPPPAQK